MKIVRTIVLFGGLLLVVSGANPQTTNIQHIAIFNGNEFLANCPKDSRSPLPTEGTPGQEVVCLMYISGYAAGFNDGLQMPHPDYTGGRTIGQVYDIVAKYIIDHPETRDQPLNPLIQRALRASKTASQ